MIFVGSVVASKSASTLINALDLIYATSWEYRHVEQTYASALSIVWVRFFLTKKMNINI